MLAPAHGLGPLAPELLPGLGPGPLPALFSRGFREKRKPINKKHMKEIGGRQYQLARNYSGNILFFNF